MSWNWHLLYQYIPLHFASNDAIRGITLKSTFLGDFERFLNDMGSVMAQAVSH